MNLNLDSIRATLKRWYAEPTQHGQWVCFDGSSVSLVGDLATAQACEVRSICKVSELGCVVGNNPMMNLAQFLNTDY